MIRYISQAAQLIRSQRSGFGKQSIIYPATFCVNMGIGVVTLGLSFYAKDVLHFDNYRVGLLMAAWPLTYVFSCLLLRPMLAGLLPRYLMILSSFVMFVMVSLMMGSPPGGWLFVLCGGFGVAMGLFWSPLMGWLSVDSEGAELNRLISRFNLSWGVGSILSPYLCGWLYRMGPALPLRVGSLLFACVAAFVAGAALVLPRVQTDRSRGAGEAADDRHLDESTPLRFVAWVGLWASFFGTGLLSAVFPLAARSDIHLTETEVGLAYLLLNLVNVGTFLVLGRTAFWHFRLWPMLASTGIRAVVFLVLVNLGSLVWVGVVMAVMGTAIATTYSGSLFHGCSGSINRARRMAIHETVLASALVVGAVMGGLLYQRFSAGAAYLLCGGVNVGALGLQAWMGARLRRKQVAGPAADEARPGPGPEGNENGGGTA